MMTDLILGTAGHIDHGKTSLIKALTGTNTDRLPEEKKRGITIELGYAQLDLPPYRLGIVDVPGHEKFVRQMLAGATGMDLALLVVAGDDSAKQQTYEHLDILRMLNLSTGVIALTKCDLCDPEWLELVEDELRQLVTGTFLENAPIIRTSIKSGQGIEELKNALQRSCDEVSASGSAHALQTPFRMAIDRVFSIAGHGTVATGSVASGRVAIGDHVQIQPGGELARVRSLQNHDQQTETVQRGQRAAINLAGVSLQELQRGQELCAPDHLVPSTLMTVELELLDRIEKRLKDRTRVRFHLGTNEVFANVRLLEGNELEPGKTALAQLYLSNPVVAVWNQPFVIRQQSPVETIGGGRVLHPNSIPVRKPQPDDLELIGQLTNEDELSRASAAVWLSDSEHWQPIELSRTAGVADWQTVLESLKESGELLEVAVSTTRWVTVHRRHLEQVSQQILKTLRRLHAEHPLRFTHARSVVESKFAYLPQKEVFALAVETLKTQKEVVANVQSIGLRGYGPQLSKGQKQLLEQLVEQLKTSGLQVPTTGELMANAKKNKDSVVELLDMAVENGDLIKLTPEFYLHASVLEQEKEKLAVELKKSGGLTVSQIREILGTTRKYAVPMCEYLDKIGFTRRQGDQRVLV